MCDYSDAYIPVDKSITITGRGTATVTRQADEKK